MKLEWNHDPEKFRERMNELCVPKEMLDAAVRRLCEEGELQAQSFFPRATKFRMDMTPIDSGIFSQTLGASEMSGSVSFQMSERFAQDLYDMQRRQYPGPEYFEGDGGAT